MPQKIYSSSLSRRSSETKPSTKLVLVSQEPLLCLKFNKPNKQNVYEINLLEKFNISQSQNDCWHTDWCQNETSKHHVLKSVKINKLTLLSVGNVPVRFRAQQRTKYSLLSLMATVSQLKDVSDTISNWFENHQPQRTQISTLNNAPFIQNSNRMASRLTTNTSFPGVFVQLLQYSRQLPSFSAHRAPLMTKTDLTCPVFSLRFLDFAVQFCFCCKFSFHEKRLSSQVWQWRDFLGPITVLCYA